MSEGSGTMTVSMVGFPRSADDLGPPTRSAKTVGAGIVTTLLATTAVFAVEVFAVSQPHYRWWANFVVIPGAALAALGAGARVVPRAGRIFVVWSGGLIFLTGALLILHAMGDGWPLMISAPCLGVPALLLWRPADSSVATVAHTMIGIGSLGVPVGITLLLLVNDIIDLGDARWWVFYMMAAGVILVVNALVLLHARRGYYWLSVVVLLFWLGLGTILAGFREIGGW